MAEYLPNPGGWVRYQVELYEGGSGKKGVGLRDMVLPHIMVTHKHNKTGGLRKVPLMRVKDGDSYVLVASKGGAGKKPVWVYELRANPDVEIRDETTIKKMIVCEVLDDAEGARP